MTYVKSFIDFVDKNIEKFWDDFVEAEKSVPEDEESKQTTQP